MLLGTGDTVMTRTDKVHRAYILEERERQKSVQQMNE
jgi:hypothetical protein